MTISIDQFVVGERVRWWYECNAFGHPRGRRSSTGRVIGYARDRRRVRVLLDGNRHPRLCYPADLVHLPDQQ